MYVLNKCCSAQLKSPFVKLRGFVAVTVLRSCIVREKFEESNDRHPGVAALTRTGAWAGSKIL
jgi:hypothetical protein